MNDTLFYWMVEGLCKGVAWLGMCLVLARWGARGGRRFWRAGWLVLGAMTLLSLAPAIWHWTWAEPTRRVMASVEAGLASAVGVEAEPTAPESMPVDPATEGGSPTHLASPRLPVWTGRQWGVAVWLAGVVAAGAWLAWGFGVAARWRRAAVAVDDPAWVETLGAEAAALGVARLPVLAVHPGAPGPCLVGVGRRPTLVLPAEYREWDLETRRAVVRHELAHVIGRDGAFAVFRSLMLALHWPNPLAWVAAAKDRREQELSADRPTAGRMPLDGHPVESGRPVPGHPGGESHPDRGATVVTRGFLARRVGRGRGGRMLELPIAVVRPHRAQRSENSPRARDGRGFARAFGRFTHRGETDHS